MRFLKICLIFVILLAALNAYSANSYYPLSMTQSPIGIPKGKIASFTFTVTNMNLADGDGPVSLVEPITAKLSGIVDASAVKGQFTTVANRISDVKKLEDNKPVTLTNKVVYFVSGSTGYIEETDKSTGIRLEGLNNINPNTIIKSLTGTIETTPEGERYINLSTCIPDGNGFLVTPFGANNPTVKTGLMTGLKVRVWGTVKSIDSDSYVVSDGADTNGITVYGQCPVSKRQFTSLTGAAGWVGGRVIYAIPDNVSSPWYGDLFGVATLPRDGETDISTDTWFNVSWPDPQYPPLAQFSVHLEVQNSQGNWTDVSIIQSDEYSDPATGIWWFQPNNILNTGTKYRIVITSPGLMHSAIAQFQTVEDR